MNLDEKINMLRKQSGLSQEELAAKLNVSRQAISKWEMGVVPDMENLVKISKYFDCSLDYLMNEDLVEVDSTDKENEQQVFTSKSHGISISTISNIMAIGSVLVMLILWIVSKFVDADYPYYKSGDYYMVGFKAFSLAYDLEILVYICFALWISAILIKTIYDLYILPKNAGKSPSQKYLTLYIIRLVLILLATYIIYSVYQRPWLGVEDTQFLFSCVIYIIIIVGISVALRNHSTSIVNN